MPRPKLEDQRREEILRAFEACVARQGLRETTLSDVATEAGLPRSLARYFVGNRDDMVELLIERMVARAESSVALILKEQANLDARMAVDALFDNVLANDTSNAIVGELWYLARRDEHARVTLRAVYARLAKELASLLGRDPRVCAPKKELESVAFSLLALAFGEASFRALGMKDVPSARVRAQAYRVVAVLTADGPRGDSAMTKRVLAAALALAALALGTLVHQRGLDRLRMGVTLFHGAEQDDNFNRAAELFPASTMPASDRPFHFPEGERIKLPGSFAYEGAPVDVEKFLADTDTSALLVLANSSVRYERYMRTGGRQVHWLSWSVAKSFISALVGIAIQEGKINSVEDAITKYVPALNGSAYQGVRIKDVLQMSSGARWDETYANPFSDVNRFGTVLFLGGSLDRFTATLERERAPGTHNHYNSADTHALGMLLTRATGRSVTSYMEEKLWRPLGMESSGRWLLDDAGMEMVFGGLNATARDYAKIGELYRLGGLWQGRQIVPQAWVHASITPDAPYLTAQAKAADRFPVGYGYQWWIPAGDEGEFSAIGIYNQFVYVNPTRNVVIVKLSAFSGYALGLDEWAYREMPTLALFRALAKSVDTDNQAAP